MEIAAYRNPAAPGPSRGVDFSPGEFHRLAGDVDRASGLAGAGPGGVEGAAHDDVAAQQADHAVVGLDAPRLDDAGVVDRALEEIGRRLGGEQHLSAISLDQAAVVDQRIDRALVDRDVEQAVAGNIEGDSVAGDQRHRAHPGRDDALVADVGAQEGDVAAIGGDRALIEDRAIADIGEFIGAGHELAVGDTES